MENAAQDSDAALKNRRTRVGNRGRPGPPANPGTETEFGKHPILAGVGKRKTGRKPKNWSLIDEHYQTIRQDMFTLFEDLRIAA